MSFTEKRKAWLEMLIGEDRHSIHKQLTKMAWDTATFQIINESRRLTPTDANGEVQLNGLMHDLINRGYFTLQMVAVRRLNDTYPPEGDRGVYSLTGLLKDMCKHRDCMTRAAILDAEGLTYDPDEADAREEQYCLEKEKQGETSYWGPSEFNDGLSIRLRHEQIDQLSGVRNTCRKPDDVIAGSIITNLSKKVSRACKEVIDHVNKFVAHALTPESRKAADVESVRITLGHLWEAHRHLCEVTGFLAIQVLGKSCAPFLPIVVYDQFKYIERPLVAAENRPKLERLWEAYNRECQQWSLWGLDNYRKEFEPED